MEIIITAQELNTLSLQLKQSGQFADINSIRLFQEKFESGRKAQEFFRSECRSMKKDVEKSDQPLQV